MKKTFLILFFVLFITSPIFAETIILKSGKIIEAKIIEKTDKNIKVDFYGVPLTYFLDEIQSIGGAKVEVAQPVGTIDKKKLLENIRETNKSIKRIQTKGSTIIDSQFMYMENEAVGDIDFEQKIIHNTSKLKDIKIKIKELLKDKLETEIASARAKGVSEDKLKEMRETSAKFSDAMSQMMNNIFKQMKDIKTESYLAGDVSYIGVNNKWFKMKMPLMSSMWPMLSLSKEPFSQENYDSFVNALPEDLKEMFSGLSMMFVQDFNDVTHIKEGTFKEKPCFIVEYDAKKIAEKFKDVIKSYGKYNAEAEGSQSGPENIDFNSCLMTNFVSKTKFLTLGSKIELNLTMSGQGQTMGMVFVSESELDYPSGSIELPSILSEAKEVENQEELKKLLMQEMMPAIQKTMPDGSL
ncbi:MAG: hypothetical protein AB1629_05180 [Candidatus Omnitrophota bacterium]